MGRPSKRTRAREKRFLAALSRGLSVGGAAAEAGVCNQTPYRWREADAEFAARWHDAYEAGTDRLEDEALRRAVEGYDTAVYYGGAKVGDIRKYSDGLLTFQIEARRPGKYRKHVRAERAERAGADVGPTRTVYRELSNTERLQEIARILGIAAAPGTRSRSD